MVHAGLTRRPLTPRHAVPDALCGGGRKDFAGRNDDALGRSLRPAFDRAPRAAVAAPSRPGVRPRFPSFFSLLRIIVPFLLLIVPVLLFFLPPSRLSFPSSPFFPLPAPRRVPLSSLSPRFPPSPPVPPSSCPLPESSFSAPTSISSSSNRLFSPSETFFFTPDTSFPLPNISFPRPNTSFPSFAAPATGPRRPLSALPFFLTKSRDSFSKK